ncbi:MAG TPA: mucoidy inhibitor MuiA family protein [Myxococcaceae bacterium]|nr:mucoidy inhibitor MuiA family protein [Myxococcaceae bacterium]
MILLSLILSAVVPPDDVIVYPDRARVSRSQTVPCPIAGPVVFEGLPPATDERSIAAVAEGAQVDGLVVRRTPVSPDEEARAKRARETLTTLERARVDLDAEHHRTEVAVELTRGLQDVTRARLMEQLWRPRPDLRAWKAALDATLRSRLADGVALKTTEARLRENGEQRDEALSRDAPRGAPAGAGAVTAEVLIRCSGAQARVSLTSTVGGASWTPAYEARWNESTRTLQWITLARIQQRTGEDWRGVRLRLSTAVPAEASDLPRPRELRVETVERPDRKKALVRTQTPIVHAEATPEEPGPGEDVSSEDAPVEDQGLSVQLAAPGRGELTGDGTTVQLRLASVKLPASEVLVARPNLRPRAYRVLRLVNTTPTPLLAGSVAVHASAGYVGKVTVARVPSGAPFELTLGVDPRIRISRVARQEAQRTGRRVEYGYTFQASNPGREKLLLEVSDRIPVSEMDEVEVRLDEGTTPGYQLAREDGVLSWKTELPPGGSRTVELRYHLEVGGGVDLSGL